MKRLILGLGLFAFSQVISQFSLADSENPSELIQQIVEMTKTRRAEINTNSGVDLMADTTFKPDPSRANDLNKENSKATLESTSQEVK